MSVTAATLAAAPAAPGNFPRLHKSTWLGKVLDYRAARAQQKEADAAARAAKSRAEVLRDALSAAMGGSPVAFCDAYVLKLDEKSGVGASLTLASGEKVPLASVKSIVLADGRAIKPTDIATVYGGRSGYTDLTVTP